MSKEPKKKTANKFEITAEDKRKKPGNARPPKKNVAKLQEDDLFGNFKSMDEFIESDSFEVTTAEGQQVASKTKKKTAHDVSKLQDDDLFGDFKSMDEFIGSDSFEVTGSEKQLDASTTSRRTSSDAIKLQEDDLFGDFKPLDEFIESDSFDVTVKKATSTPEISSQSSNAIAPSSIEGPTPPSTSPISTPTSMSGVSTPPSITPAGSPQSHVASSPITPPSSSSGPNVQTTSDTTQLPTAKPESMDPTKSKLAEIAKKRKEKKHDVPSRKGDVEGLFDDLDPLELDDED